ncbi:hypothetical protein ACFS07_01285 [Undibacterium arcticum]
MRVWASIIDTILMLFVLVPLMFAIYGREEMASGVTLSGPANILVSYILPAVAVIAFFGLQNMRHRARWSLAPGSSMPKRVGHQASRSM